MIATMNTGGIIMDILKNNKPDIERLASIYIVSNTAYFLYNRFRKDEFVQSLGNEPLEELKRLFHVLIQEGIETLEELILVYALYISITFKKYSEVREFLNGEGDITYEWFPHIKSIYLSSSKQMNQFDVNLSNTLTKIPKLTFYDPITYRNSDINNLQITQDNNDKI